MSEKDLRKIAENALKKLEEEEGHNHELIRIRALEGNYWEKLLIETLRESKKAARKARTSKVRGFTKKKTKRVLKKSEYTGEYVEEEVGVEETN